MGKKGLNSAHDFSGEHLQVGMSFYLGKKDKVKKDEGVKVQTDDEVSLLGGKIKFKKGDIVEIVEKVKRDYVDNKGTFDEITILIKRNGVVLVDEHGNRIKYIFSANLLIHHLYPISDLPQVLIDHSENISRKVDKVLK